jgi:hypothetical protein
MLYTELHLLKFLFGFVLRLPLNVLLLKLLSDFD